MAYLGIAAGFAKCFLKAFKFELARRKLNTTRPVLAGFDVGHLRRYYEQ